MGLGEYCCLQNKALSAIHLGLGARCNGFGGSVQWGQCCDAMGLRGLGGMGAGGRCNMLCGDGV